MSEPRVVFNMVPKTEVSAARRSVDGSKIVVTKVAYGEVEPSWWVETYTKEDQAWKESGKLIPEESALQQAIGSFYPDPFLCESEFEPSCEKPKVIFLPTDADDSTAIIVCTGQALHIWSAAGEYRVFVLRVYGYHFAYYNHQVFVAHPSGIFFISVSNGDMGHLAYEYIESQLLSGRGHRFINGLAIRAEDGMFAVAVNARYEEMRCLVTFKVGAPMDAEVEGLQWQGLYNGEYSSLQWSDNRPDHLVALELARDDPTDRWSKGSFSPVTINVVSQVKVSGTPCPMPDLFDPEICGVAKDKIFVYVAAKRELHAYKDLKTKSGKRWLSREWHAFDLGPTPQTLIGAEVQCTEKGQEAMFAFVNGVVIFYV